MIKLYFSKGQAFVWNADDWLKIRSDHRIIGELIGTIASQPRQNIYQGLPMVLMSEETAILIEEGLAQLVEYENIAKIPDDSAKVMADDAENRIYTDQIICVKDKRMEQLASKIDMIVAGKQKKSAKEGKVIEYNKDEILKEEIQKLPPLLKENSLVQIPTEHPWPSDTKAVNIDKLVPSLSSNIGLVRYAVFKDLWKRGYYITAGTKFGGDFLIYFGDPVKFHAAFIVICLETKANELLVSDVVAFGRLGVSVNKLTVYAYLNENSVKYQTLQWYETIR